MTELTRLLDLSAADAIPPEVAPLIKGLLEGTIKQMVVIFEDADGNFHDCFPVLDDNCSRLAMLGAMDVVKRDYMRAHVEARIEYAEIDPDDDD